MIDRAMERRNFDRLKTTALFVEYKTNESDVVFKVEIINLSAGGVCFLRNSTINQNDVIQIKFPFRSRRIIMTGKVLRIDGKEVAVQFLNPEDEIERFVKIFNKEYPYLKRQLIQKDDNYLLMQNKEAVDDEDLKNIFDIDND